MQKYYFHEKFVKWNLNLKKNLQYSKKNSSVEYMNICEKFRNTRNISPLSFPKKKNWKISYIAKKM